MSLFCGISLDLYLISHKCQWWDQFSHVGLKHGQPKVLQNNIALMTVVFVLKPPKDQWGYSPFLYSFGKTFKMPWQAIPQPQTRFYLFYAMHYLGANCEQLVYYTWT